MGESNSRVLGLDIGDVRIGVAISDPLGILASPLTIISRQETGADVQAIVEIAEKNGVERIIVGLPVSMDGSIGVQAEKVRDFIKELGARTAIPIESRDERLSTVSAKRMIQDARKTDRNTRYDAAAAALVLQGYLDEAASIE